MPGVVLRSIASQIHLWRVFAQVVRAPPRSHPLFRRRCWRRKRLAPHQQPPSILAVFEHMRGTRKLKTRLFFIPAAAAAITLTLTPALPISAAPEPTGAGGVSDTTLLTIISTAGDDNFATADLTSLLDPISATPTQHFGPYSSGSPDSGTCGFDWAQDAFNREFVVHTSTTTGAITVVEQFKDGSFVTGSGPSPAACDTTYTKHGTQVNAGVTGLMHGYFVIPLTSTSVQTSTSPDCVAGSPNASCTTAGFINSHFTFCYPVSCSATTFFDHYVASAQNLIYSEWKNASLDRGGNSGDIANT